MSWRPYIGRITRSLAKSQWLRVGLCVLYAAALILQLGDGNYGHLHSHTLTAVAGTIDGGPCQTGHDGVIKHCHTVSIISFCAPTADSFSALDLPSALLSPARMTLLIGRAVRPQNRPPKYLVA